MNINRKSGTITSGRKKLSTLGRGIVVATIIIIIAIIVFIVMAVNNSKAHNARMNDLNNAINHAIQTCRNSVLGDADALAEIERIAQEIEKEKKADKKVDLAQEAIRYSLSLTNDTRAIDELNGSRNRINVAYRNLGGA